ncbi:hypothetical protein QWY90_11225 [Flavobacterium paronense]|uniref:Beta strand repeat-containing protein n=1 Tax=Flavobacterium paronense TaxID=1392775 RepID=A0ABV5GCB9_9FLAO|nr:hypothetical protein [Flavobacterium paronense]MDN3677880.1 hypothetical protein [Flavobacterium paronense]
MKLKIYIYLSFLLAINSIYAQVGIGTASPASSSALDITSTNTGLLIPRVALLSTSDVATITSPATSLLVYNSGFAPNGYYYWNGSLWVQLATGNNTDWSLSGNSGTNPTTNFFGTTDDKDIVFKRNNARAGYIGDAVYDLFSFNSNNGNTSFGANTMLNPTVNVGTQTGVRNTGFGVNVMPGLSTGVRNVGIGEFALFSNTTGTENTATGSGALFSNIIGKLNVAIGRNALTSSDADNNTAVGAAAMRLNTSGTNNTALGFEALRNNVSGTGNVGIGYQAGRLETGSNKLYIANTNADASNALIYGEFDNKILRVNGKVGVNAAPTSTLDIAAVNATGATTNVDGILIPRVDRQRAQGMLGTPTGTLVYVNSIATGTAAGTAVNITSIGFYFYDGSVWQKLVTGTLTNDWSILGNTNIVDGTNFIGTGAATNVDIAFKRNNAAAGKIGATSTSFGVGALTSGAATNSTAFGNNALSVSTGSNNVAIGQNALQNCNTTAQWNTAVGTDALKGINSNAAQDNVAIGYGTMSLGVGNISQCTAVGSRALLSSTGANSTAVGFYALGGAAGTQTGADNTAVGVSSLRQNTSGASNTAVGTSSLQFNGGSSNNVGIGHSALRSGGGNSVAVGVNALISNTGANNTAIGFSAGSGITTGIGNVFIGNSAGSTETLASSDKLYITNSATTPITSLIYGEFTPAARILRTNSTFQIGNPAGTGYVFPKDRALSNNQVMKTDLAGNLTWVDLSTLETDPQVTSTVTSSIPKWNGTTLVDGVLVDNGTNVGVGMTPVAGNKLDVSGKTRTTSLETANLQMTAGATANYVLQSDAIGNATWVNPTTLTISEIDPQVSSATSSVIPKWNGTTLVDGVMVDNGTNVGVGVTPSAGNKLEVNGKTKTTDLQMTTGANANYVLQSDATGNASWVDPTTLTITETDPQVSSATSSVVPKWNGTTLVDGVMVDDGTNVGVGATPSAGNKLEVNGKTKTTDFQMTTGATANYVLQSDATGNASWALPNNTLSVVRTNLSAGQSLGTGGWQKINFDTVVFDLNTEFNTGTNRFVATKAGYYEVNAGYHTNNQGNTQFYSIGVYKNGALYQQTTGNHYNVGYVSRNVNCIVYLDALEYIEIFAENFQSGVTIDSYPGKTFFEVKQIR